MKNRKLLFPWSSTLQILSATTQTLPSTSHMETTFAPIFHSLLSTSLPFIGKFTIKHFTLALYPTHTLPLSDFIR